MNKKTSLTALMIIFLTLIPVFSFETKDTQTPEGFWFGVLKVKEGFELRIAMKIKKGADNGFKGVFMSLDQSTAEIPITTIDLKENIVSVEIKAIGAFFKGMITDDGKIIKGNFFQAGEKFPLNFNRTNEEFLLTFYKRPQEPKKPYPYIEEEVVFENKKEGITLSGTLTLPNKDEPCPAVVLKSGSGPNDRNESVFGHKPFLVLADYLTRNNIAVFRYDKRGIGKSKGNYINATTGDFERDALSAVEYLKTRKEINKTKIGLIGHSEGGLIASMLAADSPDIDFIIMMAGPGINGEKILEKQTELILRSEGVSEEIIKDNLAVNKKIYEIIKNENDPVNAEERIKKVFSDYRKSKKDKKIADIVVNDKEKNIKYFLSPWFKYFLIYEPSVALSKVKCPVLILYGEKDIQVLPKENLSEVEGSLKDAGNTSFKSVVFPNLNHLFQTSATGVIYEYINIEETISPDVLNAITNWIKETTK